MSEHTPPALEPLDLHNERLQANVCPRDWVNPTPSGRYNLVAIGGGAAGLVSAAGAAGLGARVALIERELMGGDCLNVGCVPSKAIISAARAAAAVHNGAEFGLVGGEKVSIDFGRAMERMRRLRADISKVDSAARFRDLGIDVFLGQATFTGSDRLQVGDRELRFTRAVIATGARAAAPPIPGLDQIPYLTNETLFALTELPKRLGIVGAGPIGCEMAQSFARFGSEVHLVEALHGALPREERDAGEIVRNALERDGVRLRCCGKHLRIEKRDDGIHMMVESHGRGYDIVVDQLLVSVGRAPNVEGLGLEAAGVEYDAKKGVLVDDRLQTSNKRIFAAGDICSRYQFTHAADFMARVVIQNALFFGRKKASALTIPWCTYTSPELAHVGLYPAEAAERGMEIDTFTQKLEEVDRAVLEGESEGFVRVHVARGSDRIVGATIVAANAGDLIGTLSLAMTRKIGLGAIASTIHPYPTQGEAIRKTGDQYNRTKLTPTVKHLFERWLAWNR
ncbi:MAG: mercuric reductase [Deltaproteobacteria bacterium]|nr:mercuric reductase [Deltaproteobacteria bacterium]